GTSGRLPNELPRSAVRRDRRGGGFRPRGVRRGRSALELRAIPLEPGPWVLVEQPLVVPPEPLLVEPGEVRRGEQGQVVQPLGDAASHADLPRAAPPAERVEPLSPPATDPPQRPDVEHRPVQQPAIGVFPLLVHCRKPPENEKPTIPLSNLLYGDCRR